MSIQLETSFEQELQNHLDQAKLHLNKILSFAEDAGYYQASRYLEQLLNDLDNFALDNWECSF